MALNIIPRTRHHCRQLRKNCGKLWEKLTWYPPNLKRASMRAKWIGRGVIILNVAGQIKGWVLLGRSLGSGFGAITFPVLAFENVFKTIMEERVQRIRKTLHLKSRRLHLGLPIVNALQNHDYHPPVQRTNMWPVYVQSMTKYHMYKY
jgi:hypothetical protein